MPVFTTTETSQNHVPSEQYIPSDILFHTQVELGNPVVCAQILLCGTYIAGFECQSRGFVRQGKSLFGVNLPCGGKRANKTPLTFGETDTCTSAQQSVEVCLITKPTEQGLVDSGVCTMHGAVHWLHSLRMVRSWTSKERIHTMFVHWFCNRRVTWIFVSFLFVVILVSLPYVVTS